MNRGRDKLKKYMFLVNFLTTVVNLFPRSIREWLYSRFRRTNGNIGLVIRYIIIRTLAKSCGFNVSIQKDVVITCFQNICFGNNVSIHEMCYIDGSGGVSIGNDVSIAHGTTIMSSTHNYKSSDKPIKNQGYQFLPCIISDNVWIGAKVTVLAGNTIAEGCILGAGSVVTKSTKPDYIYAGVPAKIIKARTE